MRRRPLSKHEVETLLTSCEGATASVLEEVTVVRVALAVAVSRLLDLDGAPWAELVAQAAEVGGWPEERRRLVAAAADPDRHADPEAVLDALWDLVQELNERRTL